MKTIHDYVHRYRGYWSDGGRCRIRIYHEDGRAPVVICSQLPDNPNISVTNTADRLLGRVHSASRVLSGVPVGADGQRGPVLGCIGAANFLIAFACSFTALGKAERHLPHDRISKRADPPDSQHPRVLGLMFWSARVRIPV